MLPHVCLCHVLKCILLKRYPMNERRYVLSDKVYVVERSWLNFLYVSEHSWKGWIRSARACLLLDSPQTLVHQVFPSCRE